MKGNQTKIRPESGRGGKRPGAGRPKGVRNKVTVAQLDGVQTLTELAREMTEAALSVLESIMNSPDVTPTARVAAANALLDRAWGRPAQRLDVDPDPGPDPAETVPVRIVRPGDEDFVELGSNGAP